MKLCSEHRKLNCAICNTAQPSVGILWHDVEHLKLQRVLIGTYIIVSYAIYHIRVFYFFYDTFVHISVSVCFCFLFDEGFDDMYE